MDWKWICCRKSVIFVANVVKVVKHWEGLCKSKRHQNKLYENLTKHYLDQLFMLRLQFFKDLTSQFRGFLELMQTDKPLVPFLEEALSDIVLTLMKMISYKSSYKNCCEIFKLVFTLSHGQASIERGFSFNKELLVENLYEESIFCQRMVYNHVNSTWKSITEIPITNATLESCKLAHSRYATALKEKKEKFDAEMKNRKRKLKTDEIAQVK